MVDKIRLVDNSRRLLHSTHFICSCETVSTCFFTYMTYVHDTVVRQARTFSVPVLQVVISKDDMMLAYRQIQLVIPECV